MVTTTLPDMPNYKTTTWRLNKQDLEVDFQLNTLGNIIYLLVQVLTQRLITLFVYGPYAKLSFIFSVHICEWLIFKLSRLEVNNCISQNDFFIL